MVVIASFNKNRKKFSEMYKVMFQTNIAIIPRRSY